MEAVQRITGGRGVHYVLECSGAPNALNEAAKMVNRGGRICLAAFPLEQVPVDVAHLEELLLKVSAFVERNPDIKELDLNPIFAYSDGAVAVDARVVLEESS